MNEMTKLHLTLLVSVLGISLSIINYLYELIHIIQLFFDETLNENNFNK